MIMKSSISLLLSTIENDDKALKLIELILATRKTDLSVEEFLLESEYRWVKDLDVPLCDVIHLQNVLFNKFKTQPVSLASNSRDLDKPEFVVPTPIKELDHFLHNGFQPGQLVELYGTAGIGKSHFCLSTAIETLLADDDGTVMYIDTENKFSAERLLEIIQARKLPLSCANRLLHQSIKDYKQMPEIVENIANLKRSHNLRLVIIDSIASLFHSEQISNNIERQAILVNLVQRFKQVANECGIAILVVNQVVGARQDSSSLNNASSIPALGYAWSHGITIRLMLSDDSGHRSLEIVKSPSSPNVIIPFQISSCGFEGIDA